MEVHVVSKLDNSQHKTIILPDDAELGKLGESAIRVRTQLVGLTSNNLSYARLGTALRWWDAYPVQQSYPEPYNDTASWGIVPAWGFAAVQESTIPDLVTGTLLCGFWATSNTAADLKLKPGEATGHWIEISEHRTGLMPLYNRYVVTSESLESPTEDQLDRLAWSSVFRVWAAGYYLDEYVFPTDTAKQAPVHPSGGLGLPWTAEDADLSSAVVVNLAASTKTARTFTYFFERRAKEAAPLGLLQVTSAVEGLTRATEFAKPVFPSNAVNYTQLESQDTVTWLRERAPSKIVILDYGTRPGGLERLLNLVENDSILQKSKTVIISIGTQQMVLSSEETLKAQEQAAALGKIQYNTSSIEDVGIATKGENGFFESLGPKWERLLDQRHQWAPDLKMIWGDGVSGPEGIEGGWDRVANGRVGADEARVYRLF
ncbi:hypothetical protein N7468_005816 [Penicillium chermesinum]|uniref:Uncharacterized protein n=1 Tax=Penicillium chermesinum TaxID=63820 RepID=A0A9W9P0J5_9EURO|nr:uncharacterized protein N7468_005816 [Penicillium chermesinum]KAJ5232860.1 hypothetical protein N7468_005816 [Penicillium chermesinum]KAJ6172510.1 hypothetical protein N7470_001577 [Penicillium chermesinum]